MAVLRCTEAFAFTDPKTGVERVVRPGDLVDEKDSLVKGRKGWFESVEANVQRVTDRAAGKSVDDGVIAGPSKSSDEKPVAAPADKDEAPPKAGAGSSRDAWVDYAESKGVEVTDDMTRDDIVEAVEVAGN
jgi:hypothetical protein